MRQILFSFLLSFIILSSFAQDSSSKKSNDLEIISHYHKAYEINGEKIRNLKPFLMTYEESAKEYKLAKQSSTIGIVFLGIGLAELTTILLTKSDKTRKFASIYIGIPSIAGMIYFGSKSGKHLKKSIAAYNRIASN